MLICAILYCPYVWSSLHIKNFCSYDNVWKLVIDNKLYGVQGQKKFLGVQE